MMRVVAELCTDNLSAEGRRSIQNFGGKAVDRPTQRVKVSCLAGVCCNIRSSANGAAMPQQLADTLFKCVRCVHFILCAVVCRRCRPKTKADDVLGPDAEEVVDVEGGQRPAMMEFSAHRNAAADATPPAALYHQERQLAQPVPQQHPPPPPPYHHQQQQQQQPQQQQQQQQQQQPQQLQQLPSPAPLRNPSPNVRAPETAPTAFAATAEAVVPVHMATILDNRGSLEQHVVSAAERSEDEVYSDELSEPEEEEEDDDAHAGGAPNLLVSAKAPVFDAPVIALTKMTPRVTDDSSTALAGRGAAMSTLPGGAGRLQQRREKREEMLQELQVGGWVLVLWSAIERARVPRYALMCAASRRSLCV